MAPRQYTISPFSALSLLLVLVTGIIYLNVYILQGYYPTFTTEDEIQAAKEVQFGIIAKYL